MASVSSALNNIPAEPRPIPSFNVDDDDENCEESFVVLEKSILPSPTYSLVENHLVNELKELQEVNNREINELQAAVDEIHISDAEQLSIASSSTSVHTKVDELIKENQEMKNVVAQNNMAMKNQIDKIMAWKEAVEKTVKTYSDKLKEAERLITNSKKENAKLQEEVSKYEILKKLQDEEIIKLKSDINKSSTNAVKVTEGIVESELQNIIAELESKFCQEAEKNKELLKRQEQNESLILSYKQNLEEKEAQICQLLVQIENNNGKVPEFVAQLKEKEDEIARLKSEKGKLSMIVIEHQNCAAAKAQFEQQIVDLKNQQIVEIQSLSEMNAKLREQLSHSQRIITSQNDQCQAKINEIENLQKQIQDLSVKNDEVFVLKNQMEIYKTDFEEEKASKEALRRDRDQIAEDLQNLQRRNQELQEEIELCRGRGFVVCTPTPSASRETQNPQTGGSDYSCPKCNFTFSTYQSLENHVHRCLDLDGFP